SAITWRTCAINDADYRSYKYRYPYGVPNLDPTLNAYTPNRQCRRTNEWCSRFGGECVQADTCGTVELRWKCSNQGAGKPPGKRKCVCCAKKQAWKCKKKTECKKAGGFCTFKKTACDAVGPGNTIGNLIKGGCKCRGKKKGHCCVPTDLADTTSTSTTTTMTTTEPKLSCSLNGTMYPHDHIDLNYCYTLRCDNGTWLNAGFPGPSRCMPCAIVEDYKMIQTFDLNLLVPYSQKNCSFSSLQESNSTTPSYYIYPSMFLEPISVEYKEAGLDAITCTDVSDTNSCSIGVISDIPQEVQPGVFAFTYNGLSIFMGKTLSVQFNNESFISYIPMTSKNSGTIGGFCGNYNGDKDDDKALRDGTPSINVMAITESWAVGTC
ncbi:unnamed protein product, partial [Meganyctiphanes norvegica]